MNNTKTPKFGLTSFGSPRRPALPIAIILGIIGGLIIGLVSAAFLENHLSFGANLAIYTLCLSPVATMLAWLIVVDRDSIPGVIKNSEHSIESTWSLHASSIAFYSLLTIVSLGLFVTTIGGYSAVSNTLLAVLLTMGACYFVSYLIVKNR